MPLRLHSKLHLHLTVQIFPGKVAAFWEGVLQDHVSVPAVLFGDGQGAGIHVDVISAIGTGRYVGMTAEKAIA